VTDVILLGLTAQRLVLDDVTHRGEWLLDREFVHQVVGSRADSIATISGNVRHMLLEVGVKSHIVQERNERFDLHRTIGNLST
jgi:hypothetical protein